MSDFYSIGLIILAIVAVLIIVKVFIRRAAKKEKPSFYTIEKGQEKYNLILEDAYQKAKKINAEAAKRNEKFTECINAKVCPKCASDLKYESRIYGDHLSEVYSCSECGFEHEEYD